MRTVGLIVATLTLGGFVAFWWRDGGPPSLVSPPASEIQASTGHGGAEPPPTPPPPSDFQPPIPLPQPHEAAPESNLAALELSMSATDASPPPRVADPIDSPQQFRERPAMTAHLSSQTSQDRVHFALDQYRLEPDAVTTLEALVEQMADADHILKLVVDGHCDDTGTDQYNQALSEMRAAVVVEFLQRRGIVVREVVTRGFGERVPVASGRDDDARAENRRADIRIDWVRKTPVEGTSVGLRSGSGQGNATSGW